MTRLVFLLFPLVGLLGAWAGLSGNRGAAFVVGIVGGLAGATIAWNFGVARIRNLSRGVNAWMGKTEVDPVDTSGGPDHRELATALNTLGAAYARRGQRLVVARPMLGDLVEDLPDPAMLFTVDGVLAASNAPARDLFGVVEEGASAIQSLGSARLVDVVAQVAATEVEVRVGSRILRARATSFADHVLLSVRDLTEARHVESVRRDFVTNASHELKTPVAGIQSLADALDVVLERDPVKARSLLARLRGESERLSTLVGDLLALRRVEADGPTGEATQVDVVRVAAEVLADVALAAEESGVELSLTGEASLAIGAVEEDVRLVLTNLASNGVKYNRAGGSLAIDVQVAPGGGARLAVSDTGIGIPKADLDRVFERFYRVDPGRSREAGGTGLGLAIVRHAVERQGGTLTVDSLLGRGTTFTVELPPRTPEDGTGRDRS